MSAEPTPGRVHIERLRLRNYRSVRECDVPLQPGLTFLVGPNGSGKSNILDGLGFISDALTTSLNEATQARGAYQALHFRHAGEPSELSIEIDFSGPEASGRYALRLESDLPLYRIVDERCSVVDASGGEHRFSVSDGTLAISTEEQLYVRPTPYDLGLRELRAHPAFGPAFEALSAMRFYNINSATVRELMRPNAARVLARDGGNLSTVLAAMAETAPETKKIVEEYLAVIVPGLIRVEAERLGASHETVMFHEEFANGAARDLEASSMSDGTLRALGVLVAAFQPPRDVWSLVGIEEPEAAVHPFGGAVLRDALFEAAERRQLIVATHSPELLDDREIDPDSLLAVEAVDGRTVVGPPTRAGLTSLQDGLFTAGELLRVNQLIPATPAE